MFLSKVEIRGRAGEFFPAVEHFDEKNLKEACYDLRIGDEVFLSEKRVPKRLSDRDPYVILPPGQFALIKTFEKVRIPRDIVAFISIRSKLKFQGLINISGFHVDPTYEGHLIFSVQNVGPNDIRLEFQQPAFMIMWSRLSMPYKEEEGVPPRPQGYDRITLEMMAQLGGPSVTLVSLQKRVEELSLRLKIYGGFAIAAFLVVLGLLLEKYIQLR
jgi:dCTP deaminase